MMATLAADVTWVEEGRLWAPGQPDSVDKSGGIPWRYAATDRGRPKSAAIAKSEAG